MNDTATPSTPRTPSVFVNAARPGEPLQRPGPAAQRDNGIQHSFSALQAARESHQLSAQQAVKAVRDHMGSGFEPANQQAHAQRAVEDTALQAAQQEAAQAQAIAQQNEHLRRQLAQAQQEVVPAPATDAPQAVEPVQAVQQPPPPEIVPQTPLQAAQTQLAEAISSAPAAAQLPGVGQIVNVLNTQPSAPAPDTKAQQDAQVAALLDDPARPDPLLRQFQERGGMASGADRRCVFIWIKPEFVVNLVNGGQWLSDNLLLEVRPAGLPPDIQVVNVIYDQAMQMFGVQVRHPSFEPVPVGEQLPGVMLNYHVLNVTVNGLAR